MIVRSKYGIIRLNNAFTRLKVMKTILLQLPFTLNFPSFLVVEKMELSIFGTLKHINLSNHLNMDLTELGQFIVLKNQIMLPLGMMKQQLLLKLEMRIQWFRSIMEE